MTGSRAWWRAAALFLFSLPLVALSAFSANPGLTVGAVLCLVLVAMLLWREGESQVLLFAVFMLWLQASLKTFYADLQGVPVWALCQAHSYETAALLSLAWVLAVAVGIRVIVARQTPKQSAALEALSPVSLFRIYLAWTLIMVAVGPLARGGFRQIVVAISDLRWAIVFAIFWSVLASKRHYALMGTIFAIELVTGFFSFFSNFRIPIFLLALAIPAGSYRIRLPHLAGALVVGAFAIYVGIIWSAIKLEYRETISGGTMEQDVKVSKGDQATELIRLVGDVDPEILRRGVEELVNRVAYVDYFAFAMDFVPAVRPHEEGLLWGNAIRHVLMPRLFFPDKPELESDTDITERYTGLNLNSGSGVTSIALGTPAETYIDYGPLFMLIPAVIVGMLYGLIYRAFAAYGPRASIAQGFAVALQLPTATLELAPTKLLGGLLTRAIIAMLLWAIVARTIARQPRPEGARAVGVR